MQYRNSTFRELLKPISRRWFDEAVERHNGNAYDKSFESWDHLVALVYAQLSGAQSLRGVVSGWDANRHHHYHLGVETFGRSTLSDANKRRPVALFAETFAMLAGLADRTLRKEGAAMLRLIDSTAVPVGRFLEWAKWNGRIHGLKLHVVYDPEADLPERISITHANVLDMEDARNIPIERGCTYAMDKAYCDYRWWTKISEQGAYFVTREKRNARFYVHKKRPIERRKGDGFTIITDSEVKLDSWRKVYLDIPMRRVTLRRDDGSQITLLTNDLKRSAVEIGDIYKARWQIELLFRWIKQNLNIRKFLGRDENAIRLQVVAAMIAFLLLRIAAKLNRLSMPHIRFAELIMSNLFSRRPIATIDKPPENNPSKRQSTANQQQMEFLYA
jgi:putative transposase